MPGLEMPVRGGGAAMLRDLRDEERPKAETAAVEGLPVAMNQEVINDETKQTDKSYDNMTNKLISKQEGQKEENQTIKTERRKPSKPVSNQRRQAESQPAAMSVADMIRQRTVQRGEQEVLKTVTLKLSPTLDEKVEKFCFENKMKKQEFWAEAAALYFEMIAEGED